MYINGHREYGEIAPKVRGKMFISKFGLNYPFKISTTQYFKSALFLSISASWPVKSAM